MATTKSNRVGVTRIKLAHLLNSKLLDVEFLPESLNSQVPFYASPKQDCCLWYGYGIVKGSGLSLHVFSYNTMSSCVKNGFDVVNKDSEYEIVAKDELKKVLNVKE